MLILRWKQKEQQHSVLNIKRLMDNAEDVERPLIIIKKKLVLVADSQLLQWEDLMVGVKNLEQEEEKEQVEWDIKKIFLEEQKMDLEVVLPLNLLKEKQNDHKNFKSLNKIIIIIIKQ